MSVISSTMRRCCLYANEISVKKSKYEIKNTLYKTDYLVSKDKLANYKPGKYFQLIFHKLILQMEKCEYMEQEILLQERLNF